MVISGLAKFAIRSTPKVCLRTTTRPITTTISEFKWNTSIVSKYPAAHTQLQSNTLQYYCPSPSRITIRGMAKQSNKVIKDKRRLRQRSLIAWERRADEKIRYNKYFGPEYISARPAGQDANMWYLLIDEDADSTPDGALDTAAALESLRGKAKTVVKGANVDDTNDQIQDEIVIEHLDRVLDSDEVESEDGSTAGKAEETIRKPADSKDSATSPQMDVDDKTTKAQAKAEGDEADVDANTEQKAPITETDEERFERYMKKQDEFEDMYDDYDEAMEHFENWKKEDLAR